jgi:hypothetical protein
MLLSLSVVHDSSTAMSSPGPPDLYIAARDGYMGRLRGHLVTAAQSASEAEKWARGFSAAVVRLLYHTHSIPTNAMNVGGLDANREWGSRHL